MPKTPAPCVGPSDTCFCGTSKPQGVLRCQQCFTLWAAVNTHAVKLLRDPKTAPVVRELFLTALMETKVDAAPEGAKEQA